MCFDEAMKCFDETYIREKGSTREDRIHGGLIILNELLRCGNATWERKYNALKQKVDPDSQNQIDDDRYLFSAKPALPLTAQHGLNTVNVTVYESAVCRQLITEKYDQICFNVMLQRIPRPLLLLNSLFSILPRLAAFKKDKFVKDNLNSTVAYLLMIVKGKEKERNLAFVALGFIAIAVEQDINKSVPKIMDAIKAALPSKDGSLKRRITIDPSIFICITLLSHAVKDLITRDIKDILDYMFATGLSNSLTTCLRELAQNVPRVKKDISEGLLRMLSHILMNKPLLHLGTPKHLLGQSMNSNYNDNHDISIIVLALNTLGSFNFDGHSLLQFVTRCADHFLINDQQEIR